MEYYLKTAIFFSLLLHLILGIVLFVHFNSQPKESTSLFKNIFQTYLVSTKHTINSTNKATTIAEKLKRSNIILISPKKITTNNSINKASLANLITTQHSDLLVELHDLIQKNTIYPKDILDGKHNKSVTIVFILYPNGNVKNIQISKSSKIAVLDQAVLFSISSIQPIVFANKFLTQPDEFSVTVEFQK